MRDSQGINDVCKDCLRSCKQFPFVKVIDCKRLVTNKQMKNKTSKVVS
jgi:hypothetical protein